jgi:hypothetical protein
MAPVLAPPLIERVFFVNRKAVRADGVGIPLVREAAQAVVARLTERPQRPGSKLVPIAAVSRKMIGDGRGRDEALLFAQAAQRLAAQLIFRPPSPRLQRVPASPGKRLRRIAILSVHLVPNMGKGPSTRRTSPFILRQTWRASPRHAQPRPTKPYRAPPRPATTPQPCRGLASASTGKPPRRAVDGA